jgi:hypothetical protein
MRAEIVSVHHARWISIQFYINVRINGTFMLLRKESSEIMPRFSHHDTFLTRFEKRQHNNYTCPDQVNKVNIYQALS